MKNHITYVNCETGECTEIHKDAMEWYRAGIEVALMDYSPALDEWIERGRWIH